MAKATKSTESKSTNASVTVKVSDQKSEQTEQVEQKVVAKAQESKKTKKATVSQETTETPKVKKSSKKEKKVESSENTKQEVSQSVSSKEETSGESGASSELRFGSQFSLLQEEMKAIGKKLGNVSMSLKKLESAYNADIKKVKKTKQKRNGSHVATGFAVAKPVPEKLAKFIGVNPGTELTGPEVTKKVWSQLKEKGLTYEKDKRVFRTNAEVSELFNVPKSVNKSVDHKDKAGFNFCNLQTFIANALK